MSHAQRRASTLLLLGLLALALALRLWRIGETPPGFHFDESFEGLEAWRILSKPSYKPIFLEGNFGVLPLNAYANALSFGLARLLGVEPGPVVMRVTAALFGVLGVLAVWWVAVELRRLEAGADTRDTQSQPGSAVATRTDNPGADAAIHRSLFTGHWSLAFPLWAAGALAVMRWHIHFSRMGIEPVFVPLLWAAGTALLLRGWRTGSRPSFAGAGALVAASIYAYQGAWVLPFIALATVAILWAVTWRQRDRRARRLGGALLAGAVAALLVAPLGWYFWQRPDALLLRPSQIAVVGEDAPGAAGSPAGNAVATAAMFWPFGATGDLDPRRNLPGAPALPVWLALPFLGGLLLALARILRPAYAIVLVGLAGMLSVGVFSEYAPHFHRILGAAAPAALLVGVGLDALWQWRPFGTSVVRWAAPLLLAAGAVAGARDYFVRWATLPDLYYAFDAGLWEIGGWAAVQPPGTPIYISPRSPEHPTLAFALETRPDSHVPPVSYDGRHVFPLAGEAATDELYVAIEAEDFRTRLLLPEVFPGATVAHTFRDWAGQPYANVYRRPAGSESARPPMRPLQTPLGDGIALLGYDVQPATVRPGEILYVQLHWSIDAAPAADWTVFVHLTDPAQPDAPPLAGKDSPPGNNSLPTARWQPGWIVLDEYQLALPPDLPPGAYALRVGMYSADGSTLPPDGQGIELGTVTIQ